MMKNITQYFDDGVKPGNSATNSNDEAKEECSYNKRAPKGKRNRVKIKISRSSTSGRICDILETSDDKIDKTPSPFTKENGKNESQRDTPRRTSTSKSILAMRRKTLTDNNQNVNHPQTNNCNSNSSNRSSSNNNKKTKEKESSEDSSNVCTDTDRKLKKEWSKKEVNINKSSCISKNIKVKGRKIIDEEESIDIDSNDEIENDKAVSPNAFAILMGHNKSLAPCFVQMKQLSPPEAEGNVKRSAEYKEKLIGIKEKLEALADKRGYSKRKVAEMEESEQIEEMIKDRLKLFKGEKKKDNSTITSSLNQKQSAGTLFNYFSKAPVDLNTAGATTVLVKADVHATQSDDQCQLTKRSIQNGHIRRSRRNVRSDLDLSEADDIKIVKSENVEALGNKGKQDKRRSKKRSLKVNVEASENENTRLGNNGEEEEDEEIFTPRDSAKFNMKSRKKSEKDKTERIVSTQSNCAMKLRKKKDEGIENKQESHKLDKYEPRLITCDIAESDDAENEQNREWSCHNKIHNNSRRKESKLAPLFAIRKKPDPEAIAARRLFLQPNPTDNCIKSINRKMTTVNGALPFPLISHVTQLSGSSVFNETNVPNILNVSKVPTEHVAPVINVSNFKDLIDCSKKKLKSVDKLSKPKVLDVLAELGKSCSNVQEIWNTVSVVNRRGSGNAVKSQKSSTSRKRKQSEKEKTGSIDEEQSEYCSWTYKYRPKRSRQVIGNDEAVGKLKDWLVGWCAISTTNGDSGDEFYQSDNSRSANLESNKVAVLLGPHGCGKTASIYAIAEEFGYTVLELNASSRRTGKKLSKEFEEATKSHRIKNNSGKTAVAPTITLYCDTDLDEIESKNMPRNSLILLEDVDLIFEEDEGFVSAVYQLALNSKRPIVMTCRDVCPHLSKMAPQQNKIYFQRPNTNALSALLELISLAETGYRLPNDFKTDLLQTGDLRRCLLQLQYLLLSGPPRSIERGVNLKNLFWHSILYNVYKPAVKVSRKSKKSQASKREKINDRSILTDVASKLDDVALMSRLTDVQDTALDLSAIKFQPNLSFAEDTSLYSTSSNLSLEISEWIGNKVMRTGQLTDSEMQHHNKILCRKQINKNVDLVLSRATSFVLDRNILATDYLPYIRTICRAEQSRANTNNKRGNRFFHYVHNLKAVSPATASSVFKPNILTAACNMLYDAGEGSETSRTA